MSYKLFTALTINLMNLPHFFALSERDIQALNNFSAMLSQGKIRVLSRLGITQPNLVYNGYGVLNKKTRYQLEREAKKLGYSIKGSASPTDFVVAFLRSRGVNLDTAVVARGITLMGFDADRDMRVVNILRSIIGLPMNITTTNTVSKMKGKQDKKTNKTNYGSIKVVDVDRAVFNWVKNNVVIGQTQSQSIGVTFYGVPTNIREIDQVFGTVAPIAVDAILIGDTWFVTGVNYNVTIDEKTPFVTNTVIHDVNTSFVRAISSLFSSLKMPATQLGLTDTVQTLEHVFTTGGLTALYRTWLAATTEMNRSDNPKIAAAHEQVTSIKDYTPETDKTLGNLGATVYDEVSEDLVLVGAAQQTGFGQSLFGGSGVPSFGQQTSFVPQQTGFGNFAN